jgi:hypothetical protein
MNKLNASAIASHNDGVLAWLRDKIATLTTDDKSAPRYPALSGAFERFGQRAAGLIAQTGFLPSGSNAGAKDQDVNKPFDVLPHPQGHGIVYAMANPRIADQDTAVVVAILAALALTTDETSTHDADGKPCQGGGYTIKKRDAADDDAQPRVKSNNKTFGALIRELNIKKEGKVFEMPAGYKTGMRESGVPVFPAEARSLPVPKGRPSGALKFALTVQGKDKEGKKASVSLDFNMNEGAENVLFFLSALPKTFKVSGITCARDTVVASWSEVYAGRGFSLTMPEAIVEEAAEIETLTGTEN